MKLVRWLCLVLSMTLCLVPPVQGQTATRTFVVYAGTYSGTQTYAKGDVVLSGATYYLSLSGTNIGHTPASSPTYWSLFSSSTPQVNSTNLLQSLPNFIDSPSVKFTNPTGGQIQASVGVVPNTVPTQITTTSCSGSTSGTISAATLTMACSGTYTKGNTIVLTMMSTQTLNAFNTINTGVSDSQGNVWMRVKNVYGFGFSDSGAVYVATNIAGGADTITVVENVSNGASNINMLAAVADEFSGVNTANPTLQSAASTGTSGATASSFNLPVTQSGDILYGAITEENTGSSTFTGTNYTSLGSFCPTQGSTHMCLGRLIAVSSIATPALWAPTFNFTSQGGDGSYFFVELVGSGNPAINPVAAVTQLNGDVTTPATGGNVAATLATVNGASGACGDASHICAVTTNPKGLVTSQSTFAVTSGMNQLTGDVTAGPGTGSQAATLATVNSTPGTCGDATHVCAVTSNGKGLITGQSSVGITGQAMNVNTITVPLYVLDTGAANALVGNLTNAATSLVAGLEVHVLPVAANTTTTPTLNLNGLGAKTIVKSGNVALAAGDLSNAAVAVFIYDGTNWQLQNPQGSAGITSAAGIATISGTTLTVGKVSPVATTSVVISNASVNTLNTSNSGAIYNLIVGGNGNSTGSNTYQFIGGGLNNTAGNNYVSIPGGHVNSASGDSATISGGFSNTANGAGSVVIGGSGNSASNAESIAGGFDSIASGNVAVALGDGCTASGDHTQCHGHGSTASGARSFVFGETAIDRGNTGSWIFSPGGPSQTASFPDRMTWEEHMFYAFGSGSSTTVRLTADGGAASASNVAALGSGMAAYYSCSVMAIDRTTQNAGVWYFGPSVALRTGAASTMTIPAGNPAATVGGVTSGFATFAAPTITADTTNGGFNISIITPSGNTDNYYMEAHCRMLTSFYQ